MGIEVELRRIPAPPRRLGLPGFPIVSLEALQLTLDFLVHFGELGSREVEGGEGLLEGEQMLGPPIALQALGDFLRAGLDVAFFKAASTCPSRSPARMARRIFWPVSPATSEMTLASWMFIWVKAFCMCWTLRAWFFSSMSRCRQRERSTQI